MKREKKTVVPENILLRFGHLDAASSFVSRTLQRPCASSELVRRKPSEPCAATRVDLYGREAADCAPPSVCRGAHCKPQRIGWVTGEHEKGSPSLGFAWGAKQFADAGSAHSSSAAHEPGESSVAVFGQVRQIEFPSFD